MRRNLPYITLAALCGLLFFLQLGSVPLIGLDESLYAGCSREMLTNGNYIVPTQNGEYFFDKPPLTYWLQAGSMRIFGVNSFGARLPSALAALALVAWTVFLGTRLFNRRTGLFSGFILAASLLFAGLARMCLLDQIFTLTISLALGSFLLAYQGKCSKWGYLLFWAMTGITALAKGPAGPVLVFITITAFLIIRRQPVKILKTKPLLGILVFLAVALPWYALVQHQTHGAFFREFFVHQNVQRAMGKDFSHNQPFWFYLPIYLVGFFPWSVFIPSAWKNSVRLRPEHQSQEAALFLAISTVTVIAVFSALVSKLPHYILPSIPPSALLVGLLWSRSTETGKLHSIKLCSAIASVVSMIVAAALLIGPHFLPTPIPDLTNALIPMAGSLIVGSVISLLLLWRNNTCAGFAAFCGGIAGFVLFAVIIGLPIAAQKDAVPIAELGQRIQKTASDNATIIVYRNRAVQAGLGFYSGQIVKKTDDSQSLRRAVDKPSLVVIEEGDRGDLPKGGRLVFRSGSYCLYRFN